MGKIIYLPLEHIESRYTVHMDRDILKYLANSGKEYLRIYPDIPSPQKMKAGSFLDAEFTIRFKAAQIAEVARLYREDVIDSGDIVWSSDLWHPGLPESIAYMNYFARKNVRLRGLIHAGSFTDTDFVRDMERWAKNFEDTLFDIADTIYCGSEFIKNDIVKKRVVDPDKLVPTGFPLDVENLDKYKGKFEKENIIVFSGRNVDEKQPWLFKELSNRLGNKAEFINTLEHNFSKEEYYNLLSKSKWLRKSLFDMAMRHTFEGWMAKIQNHGANIQHSTAHNDIYGQGTVTQLRRDGSAVSTYELEVVPTSVAAIDLAWESNDAVEEYTVTFSVNYWVPKRGGFNMPSGGSDNTSWHIEAGSSGISGGVSAGGISIEF